MTIHVDNFYRKDGTGSRTREEDWLDVHSTAAENEWSRASTTFYMSEVPPSKQDRFESLYEWQHYKSSENRSTEARRMEMAADAETFSSMLELPDPAAERVSHVMEGLDWPQDRFGGKSYEKVILAVCSLVHDEELSSRRPESVQYDQRLIFDETFRDLMEANGLGSSELRGIRQQLRERTSFF